MPPSEFADQWDTILWHEPAFNDVVSGDTSDYAVDNGPCCISTQTATRRILQYRLEHETENLQVMKERDDSETLSGTIQLDDVYWGGERRGRKAHKRGRGSANKTPFVAAVVLNEEGHPTRMHRCVVKGFRSTKISTWSKRHIAPGSIVISDGLACFSAVKGAGCSHKAITTGGGPDRVTRKEFVWVNTLIGNVRNALVGTYHAINHKHLPRYLAEFCYRFNRRFQLEDMLPRFYYVAARTSLCHYAF